jgi:hypothetical protein
VRRIVFGFLVCALGYPFVALLSGDSYAISGALAVASISIPITVLVAVPLFFLLRSRDWLGLWKTVGTGAAAGLLASIFFAGIDWYAFLFISSVFAPMGAVHALIFWFIAVYRNGFLQSSLRLNAQVDTET